MIKLKAMFSISFSLMIFCIASSSFAQCDSTCYGYLDKGESCSVYTDGSFPCSVTIDKNVNDTSVGYNLVMSGATCRCDGWADKEDVCTGQVSCEDGKTSEVNDCDEFSCDPGQWMRITVSTGDKFSARISESPSCLAPSVAGVMLVCVSALL